ncbi:MAG: TIGR03619 family F420-dependent LLM class oxidoreductase [Myxococcota bacterium]
MKLGVSIRTMGPQSTRETILGCARAAEEAGLDDLFVVDHIAIPPDDAEGSDGRYLDPLSVLMYLAGATERIGLGTGVLILPYRPALPTAKVIATLQEMSGNRLRLGVGVGWMEAEFRALGVDRRRRGRLADEVLDLLERAFAGDVVEENGQPFFFRPRPDRPPIYIGGAPPHAFRRALRYGDGWMPMGRDPEKLRAPIEELRAEFARAGRSAPEIVVMTGLSLEDPGRAVDQAAALADVGATRLVCGTRYAELGDFERAVDVIATKIRPHTGARA